MDGSLEDFVERIAEIGHPRILRLLLVSAQRRDVMVRTARSGSIDDASGSAPADDRSHPLQTNPEACRSALPLARVIGVEEQRRVGGHGDPAAVADLALELIGRPAGISEGE